MTAEFVKWVLKILCTDNGHVIFAVVAFMDTDVSSIYKPETTDYTIMSQHAANLLVYITHCLYISLLSQRRVRRDARINHSPMATSVFIVCFRFLHKHLTKEGCSWSTHKPSTTNFTSLVQGQKPHFTASDNSAHLNSFLSWATSNASVHIVSPTRTLSAGTQV